MSDAERYSITLRRVEVEGEGLWRATVKELPDLAEFADTKERAFELALEAVEGLKKAALDEGRSFPEPADDDEEYSGRVTVRMPISVHRSISQQAEQEGVSLNSYIVEALMLTLAERLQRMSALATRNWPVAEPQWITMTTTGVSGATLAQSANAVSVKQMGESSFSSLVVGADKDAVLREKRTRQ
jgi:predicted HicB family RNase H-like nuclease